jgi:hypothetical protein
MGESSPNFPILRHQGNITPTFEEKITPAVRGTLFPSQKKKKFFAGGIKNSLLSVGFFPFLKNLFKKSRNFVNKFYGAVITYVNDQEQKLSFSFLDFYSKCRKRSSIYSYFLNIYSRCMIMNCSCSAI